MNKTLKSIHETLKSIPKFDGKDFREWTSKVRMSINYRSKRLFGVLNTNGTAIEQWSSNNCDLFSILFFATTGSANILVRQFEGARNKWKL